MTRMSTTQILVFVGQILLAMLVGLATSYQPGANAKFASVNSSPIYGGIANFGIGFTIVLIVTMLMRAPPPTGAKLATLPWWAWSGGFLGAFFVCMAILLIRRMGAANYFAAMVVGQFVGSMVIDHFGHVGLPVHSFSWGRAVGVVLMLAGLVCIRLT